MISKKELITRTAAELGITIKDCTLVVDMFIEAELVYYAKLGINE